MNLQRLCRSFSLAFHSARCRFRPRFLFFLSLVCCRFESLKFDAGSNPLGFYQVLSRVSPCQCRDGTFKSTAGWPTPFLAVKASSTAGVTITLLRYPHMLPSLPANGRGTVRHRNLHFPRSLQIYFFLKKKFHFLSLSLFFSSSLWLSGRALGGERSSRGFLMSFTMPLPRWYLQMRSWPADSFPPAKSS